MEDDFELLDAWANGDSAAGNALFTRHFPSVFGFFRNKIDDGFEDLVQQTFLGCVESRGRFRREASFRTFLFATAKNVLYKAYRKRRRHGGRIDFGTVSAVDLAPSPSAVLVEREEQRVLVEALRSIPLDYQVALELYYCEGLTGPELADILELKEAGARSRLHRAREALRVRITALEPAAASLEDASFEHWARSLRELMRREG